MKILKNIRRNSPSLPSANFTKFSILTKIIFCATILFSGCFVASVYADELSDAERACQLNNACGWNPNGFSSGGNCTIGAGTYTGETSAGLTEIQAGFVDTYHDIASQLSVEYGIPWETVIAQGIVESAAGTSNFAITRNNFFGIGAFDSNPDNAYYYDTPMEGWKGYFENIRKTSTYRAHGVFTGKNITDPYEYLIAIKTAGYATDPNYINKISYYISAIITRSKQKSWLSSQELYTKYPEMAQNAAKNSAGAGEEPSTNNNYTDSYCVSSGNGDINETAINISWPEDQRYKDSQSPLSWSLQPVKPAYQTALAETGINQLGDNCSKAGASCDAFVATVMRYSGTDPDFYCCGASAVLNYLINNSDSDPNSDKKYLEIPNTGNSSDLMPGDIRSRPSHVEMYVQRSDGTYGIASASHCQRTSDHARNFYPNSEYKIFRFKNQKSNNERDKIDSKE